MNIIRIFIWGSLALSIIIPFGWGINEYSSLEQEANGELEQDCKVKIFRVNPEFAGIRVANELEKRINLFIKDMNKEDYYIEYASLRAALVYYRE